MEINPIAFFHSPLKEKFGIPRQAGLAGNLQGTVKLEKPYDSEDTLRGLEGFEYLWLIWGFDRCGKSVSHTVRPPRLGGNEKVGVFASRSPFRPNGLGLSSVKIERIDFSNSIIHVLGADLADGTPIYDIKPYVEYADSHPGAKSGFVDENEWEPLTVVFPEELKAGIEPSDIIAITELLSQDPRPGYQNSPERIYGMIYDKMNIRFKVNGSVLVIVAVEH